MNTITLITDQALGEGTDTALDGLGFNTYARVLADAAAGTPGPFNIGIFGEWGTGKTSLMRLIEANLKPREQMVTVWFNAWRYEKEEHPIVPLVGTIVRSLESQKPLLEKVMDGGRSLIKALRAVAYGFSAKSKVRMPGFAEIEASFVAKDMIDRSEKLTADPLLDRSLYYEAFENLSSLTLPEKMRIVVFIDDLDRCFPDLAIKLLESVKLVLSQPGFIFVMGVARNVIEGYLKHRYEKEYGIANFQGHSYLDKMVQLPFYIPPHTARMKEFSENLLGRIDRSMGEKLSGILSIIWKTAGGNPRSTIRFINNLLIDVGINMQLVEEGTMQEIPIEYFAITRCLQQRWPQVFLLLTGSADFCCAAAGWDEEAIPSEGEASSPAMASLAAAVRADRELFDLLRSDQGKSWCTDHNIRSETIQFLKSRQETEDKAEKLYDVCVVFEEPTSDIELIIDALLRRKMRLYRFFHISDFNAHQVLEWALPRMKIICIFVEESILPDISWQRFLEEDVMPLVILLPGSSGAPIPRMPKYVRICDFRDGVDSTRAEGVGRLLKSKLEGLQLSTDLD